MEGGIARDSRPNSVSTLTGAWGLNEPAVRPLYRPDRQSTGNKVAARATFNGF